MPELRTDWLTGRTGIIAENRAQRPNEFALNATPGEAASAAGQSTSFDASSPTCPFCIGNESQTPPSVYQATDEQGRWRIRVVPNRFPAVELQPAAGTAEPAVGAHEVIIESSRHLDRMSAMSASELRDVLTAYTERLCHWRDDGRFGYGLVFKNQGQPAGASLAHVHSQLVALPNVPPAVERELQRAKSKFEQDQHCAYCRLCERERSHGERVVLDRDGYIAFCPNVSLQPLEVWLLPTEHEPWFERPGRPDALERLARVLHYLMAKLESLVPGASYNMLVRTSPWPQGVEPWCHWRIELLPRFNPLAGLELATGVHINPLPPERAATQLRTG
jgi:UDPglucose--hexose-1-phosphate uridylyltransferase